MATEHWPVHIVVLQFARHPDSDDPINWPWHKLDDDNQVGTEFVTGGVMGHREVEVDEEGNPL